MTMVIWSLEIGPRVPKGLYSFLDNASVFSSVFNILHFYKIDVTLRFKLLKKEFRMPQVSPLSSYA